MTQDEETMEQEITKEENLKAEPSETSPKKAPRINIQSKQVFSLLKTFVLRFKRPRMITIIILFSTLVLVSIGLNLLSKKNQEAASNSVTFQNNSPSPETSTNPNTESITKRVKVYTDKLNSLDNYQQKLQKPIVDLDISFK